MFLPRRGNRTKPGVLTPGAGLKTRAPRRGGRSVLRRRTWTMNEMSAPNIFRPFPPSSIIPELRRTGRAGRRMDVFLGLKPQAESYCPFGAETKCSVPPLRGVMIMRADPRGPAFASPSPLPKLTRPEAERLPKRARQMRNAILTSLSGDLR